MDISPKKRIQALFLASLFLSSACTSIPNELLVEDESSLTDYEELIQQPVDEIDLGSQARWAGMVVSIEQKNDLAELEILYLDQTRKGEPYKWGKPQGRFKAYVDASVAETIEERDFLTIVGKVGEAKAGLIDNKRYTYPTLEAERYFVWYDDGRIFNPDINIPAWNTDRICCQNR